MSTNTSFHHTNTGISTNPLVVDVTGELSSSSYTSQELTARQLTSVDIGTNVTSIGYQAFFRCSSLTSVTIGNNVTSIGDYAFYNCSSLTSVTIPNSVTSIGQNAFRFCTGLIYVTIGNKVTSIGAGAFFQCSSLTSVIIPDSVTSIGNNAFYYCSSLTSVTIGNNVTSIGEGAFQSSGLTSVIIPDSVTSIGNNAFNACSGLKSVTIGNDVTSIGDGAFFQCSSLTSVIIPDSVTSIGDGVFNSCYGLTSVTIGNNVTSIGNFAFRDCSSLTSVIIPDSVTSIGTDAFFRCSSLTSVTIGNNVTSIGGGAFNGCPALSSVIIPDSVTSIGQGAFVNCSSLTSVTIEDATKITTINANSFTDVTSDPSSVIIFEGVQDWVELQAIWNANNLYNTWDAITQKFSNQIPVRQLPPNLSNFSVPTKIYGELSFQITPPDSDSDGSFNYTSSNTDVATISGDIITIVYVGNTIITATQEETLSYLGGSITASFEVIDSTYVNTPTPIYSGEGLSYIMTTTAVYADIKNDIEYNGNKKTILQSSSQKYISTLKGKNKKIINNNTDNTNDYFPIFTGHFGGMNVNNDIYTFPQSASPWAGVANENFDIYPLTFPKGGKITFSYRVVTPGVDVHVRFRIEKKAYPDVLPAYDTSWFLCNGQGNGEIEIPSQDSKTFSSLLLYLQERDRQIELTNFVVQSNK